MSLLSFLKTSKVEDVAAPVRVGTPGVRKQRNPNPAILAIRVWKDGSVYPSQALVAKFDLEYADAKITKETLPLKDGETTPGIKRTYEFPNGTGNGMDVIDSREWNQYKASGDMLFVGVLPKNQPKVDLFGQTAYDDATGKPKSSVLDQGTQTFGKTVLLPLIKEVYNIELTEEQEFVDMGVFESLTEGSETFNITENFSKPIIFAPKRITRGADKGKADYSRRENMKVYGFAPLSAISSGTAVPENEIPDLTEATPAERAAALSAE